MLFVCPKKQWGMGTTVHGPEELGYGFPETDDPTKFHPDYEVCSEEEIKNHKEAVKEWCKPIQINCGLKKRSMEDGREIFKNIQISIPGPFEKLNYTVVSAETKKQDPSWTLIGYALTPEKKKEL